MVDPETYGVEPTACADLRARGEPADGAAVLSVLSADTACAAKQTTRRWTDPPPHDPWPGVAVGAGHPEWRLRHRTGNGHGSADRSHDPPGLFQCRRGRVRNQFGWAVHFPVAIPANLLSAATIQLALVAKIAAARGYDVHSPETQQKALLCLCGTSVAEVLKDLGIRAGKKLTQQRSPRSAGRR